MSSDSLAFLRGGGEMGALIRAFDWSSTSLGRPDHWPQSLRTALGILLNSRYPMFVFWGPELLQIYNDAYRPVPGAKHPWALGRPAQQIWSEVWADIGPLVARALNGDPTWAENLMLVVNRNEFPEEVYFTFSYSPIPDEEGIGGMFCACTETTAQVLAERRLRTLSELAVCATARSVGEACARSAEALERNAADVPFALIYLVTENGATSVAASAGLSAGGPLDEGTVAHELLTAFGDAPGGGAAVIHDLPARVSAIPPGPWSETPTSALLLPVVNPLGRTVALCVFGISSRRPLDADYRTWLELLSTQVGASIASAQAFEDQRKQAQALAELDRAKTTFFSNISHEFRTPLTLILGPLEDALSAAAGEEDRQRLMLMHRNALRLQKLVNTLLEFARIEAGRLSANLVATDLSELTLDLVSAFRAACDKAGLRLSIHCDPLRAPVAVDREMWEKIVLNLMSNALKYTFDGEIAVRVQDSDDAVVMSVTDTGIGIGVEHLPHLFERFHRVEGARARTQEGSGIGLALVHEFVRLNGGGIDVQSAPGRGTTFSVSVPRRPPVSDVGHTAGTLARSAEVAVVVDQAMRWMEQPAGEPAGLAAPGSARILVVDDNSDMRAYLCRLLGGQYDVRAASDGEAALDEVRHHAPDLIVSDVMMPGLDGFGLLQRLRSGDEHREVPFLLLTAKADEDARVHALSLGVDDYLIKPFSARELRARVDALLRLAQMRREASDALRDAEARFRQMADDAPMMVWVTDGNGVCTFLSKSWYEFTGQTAESGLAFGWVSAIHPEDRVKVRETFFAANRSRGPYRFEYRLQHAEGGYRWVLGAAAPRLDPGSEFRGYIGSVIDITERKETEDRRQHLLEAERQARVDAERINAAKDGFLATLSHELRAPLNTIVGWSELLVEKSLDPVEARDAVSIIARAAETQSAMIEDLLDMSRIVSGRVELTVEPVSLEAIVRQSVQAVRPAAEAKGLRVVEAIDAPHSLVRGDPQRLRQIFGNILVNAVKFTPVGGLVSIRVRRRDDMFDVVIADTGEGIAPSFLPNVFDRFRQADVKPTRPHAGLGIGLSIVKHLVELHGGIVSAASDGLGRGAAFTVSLPAIAAREPQAEAPAGSRERGHGATLATARVLIVDDDVEARRLISWMYSHARAEAVAAASAAEALELLSRMRFDLLVSDIGMPGEDGFDLIRAVRKLPASQGGRIPAIALTGYARLEDRRLALTSGFHAHLPKPVNQSVLLRLSQRLIQAGPMSPPRLTAADP